MRSGSSTPFDYRIGDRLRLRKQHPCGGWTWIVVRLGADIGLSCETCGRKVMLDRPTLERRVKSVLQRGSEPEHEPKGSISAESLDVVLSVGDLLRPVRTVPVAITCYFRSSLESITGKVSSEDLVQVVALPSSGSQEVRLAPVERKRYEQTYIPGGLRTRDTYEGFDIVVDYSVLARDFTTDAVPDLSPSG